MSKPGKKPRPSPNDDGGEGPPKKPKADQDEGL